MSSLLQRFETHAWIGSATAFALLVIVVGIVYGRAAHAPFVHDDNISVLGNPSIVQLWPPFGTAENPGPLNPPRDAVTSGRPLVNFSLALNYHFGAYDTLGYHVVNAVLHLLSALLLFGVVRRTLLLDCLRPGFGCASTELALAVALVWTIHPLQSDAVEYVSQRTELLMGLFYLATLYCSLRYFTAQNQAGKIAAATGATLACLAGMACKEVMVSAPVMVLLFDRTFLVSSVPGAVKKSWPLYAGLSSGWLLLLALNIDAPRSHAAGLQAGLPVAVWWFTQAKVLLLYLKLSVWPWPLVIHHETPFLWTLSAALPWMVPVAVAAVGTLILLWRRNPVGYLGTWFFVILSPTLAVPMPSEVAAERRMYLPLAALVVLAIVGGFAGLTRLRRMRESSAEATSSLQDALRPVLIASTVLVIVFSVVTSFRLETYRDVIAVWRDAVANQPNNVRASINLGCVLQDAGRHKEAVEQFEHALLIDPDSPDVGLAHRSLGLSWASLGERHQAIEHLELAMRLRPDVVKDHGALGSLLLDEHRFSDAIKQLQLAVRDQPTDILAHSNLAAAYANIARWPEAVGEAEKAQSLAAAQGNISAASQLETWLATYRGRVARQ